MKPSEMSLFSEGEQAVLVAAEKARLASMSEDELGDLLVLVRRARNKYSKLHRRQASASVRGAGKRYAATTSNTRTLRKAEIFEDALARVSTALARAARASSAELRRERLELARGDAAAAAPSAAGRREQPRRTADSSASKRQRSDVAGGAVTPKRAASTRATNARRQAARDRG